MVVDFINIRMLAVGIPAVETFFLYSCNSWCLIVSHEKQMMREIIVFHHEYNWIVQYSTYLQFSPTPHSIHSTVHGWHKRTYNTTSSKSTISLVSFHSLSLIYFITLSLLSPASFCPAPALPFTGHTPLTFSSPFLQSIPSLYPPFSLHSLHLTFVDHTPLTSSSLSLLYTPSRWPPLPPRFLPHHSAYTHPLHS